MFGPLALKRDTCWHGPEPSFRCQSLRTQKHLTKMYSVSMKFGCFNSQLQIYCVGLHFCLNEPMIRTLFFSLNFPEFISGVVPCKVRIRKWIIGFTFHTMQLFSHWVSRSQKNMPGFVLMLPTLTVTWACNQQLNQALNEQLSQHSNNHQIKLSV